MYGTEAASTAGDVLFSAQATSRDQDYLFSTEAASRASDLSLFVLNVAKGLNRIKYNSGRSNKDMF